MKAGTRNLIRNVEIRLLVKLLRPFDTDENDDEWKSVLEAVMNLLPNIEHVKIYIAFIGWDVPEWQVAEVVQRVLKILACLKDFSGLAILNGSSGATQRARITEQIRENLGCQRAG